MFKIFLSMPRYGKVEDDIDRQRQNMINYIRNDTNLIPDDVEVMFSEVMFDDTTPHSYCKTFRNTRERIMYLTESIREMVDCNIVVFYPECWHYSDCSIQRDICSSYNIPCIYIPPEYAERWEDCV